MRRNGRWYRAGGVGSGSRDAASQQGECVDSRRVGKGAVVRRVACALVAWALLAGCASGERRVHPAVAGTGDGPMRIEAWTTTSDHRLRLSPSLLAFDPVDGSADIEVDAGRKYQQMVGFGASITDASAWLIQHRMTPAQREELLRGLFGRDGDGIGFDFARLTIGASDFSRSHYSLDQPPDGNPDPALRHFSIDENRDAVIPVTLQALGIPSLVAVLEGEIVAHIAYTYDSVEYENGERDTYASFGPVSVLPDRQRKGIGQKLIDHSLVCARKDRHRAIFITGSSEYYSRFGFRPAHESGITLRGMNPNERADYFMVLELEEGALQGQRGFLDFDPLFDVKAEDVDKFDRAFPIRRKEAREGQL